MIGPKDKERIHCVEGRFIFLAQIVETTKWNRIEIEVEL